VILDQNKAKQQHLEEQELSIENRSEKRYDGRNITNCAIYIMPVLNFASQKSIKKPYVFKCSRPSLSISKYKA